MRKSRHQKVRNGKRRIERRLRAKTWSRQDEPMFKASNIHYELSERTRGVGVGGIGAMHKLALVSGLVKAIDEGVDVLKVHRPYHEPDHVLNMAYNILSGGTCLQDIELSGRHAPAYHETDWLFSAENLKLDHYPRPRTLGRRGEPCLGTSRTSRSLRECAPGTASVASPSPRPDGAIRRSPRHIESRACLSHRLFRYMSTTLRHSRAAFSEPRLWWGDS